MVYGKTTTYMPLLMKSGKIALKQVSKLAKSSMLGEASPIALTGIDRETMKKRSKTLFTTNISITSFEINKNTRYIEELLPVEEE
jgi:translation elongation factor EF-1alpha